MAFTLIQSTVNGAGGTVGTDVIGSSTPVTAGHMMIVPVIVPASASGVSVLSVTDSAGNTYTPLYAPNYDIVSSNWRTVAFYKSIITTGGALTITATASTGAIAVSLAPAEYSFDGTYGPPVFGAGTFGFSATSTTSLSAGAVAISNNSLVFALVDGSGTVSTTSPYSPAVASTNFLTLYATGQLATPVTPVASQTTNTIGSMAAISMYEAVAPEINILDSTLAGGSGTSESATFSSNVLPGEMVFVPVLLAANTTGAAVTSCSDNKGNLYTKWDQVPIEIGGGTYRDTELWVAGPIVTGGLLDIEVDATSEAQSVVLGPIRASYPGNIPVLEGRSNNFSGTGFTAMDAGDLLIPARGLCLALLEGGGGTTTAVSPFSLLQGGTNLAITALQNTSLTSVTPQANQASSAVWSASAWSITDQAFTPTLDLSPQISRSGHLAFVANSTIPTVGPISGTVTIPVGGTTLTCSTPQVNLINATFTVSGDSSSGTYRFIQGNGVKYSFLPAYGGSGGASGATLTLTQQGATTGILSIYQKPTVSVQFGGTGGLITPQMWGPFWESVPGKQGNAAAYGFDNQNGWNAMAFWYMACGYCESVAVQFPGSGYSFSPSAAAATGSATFGTPVVSPGVSLAASGGSGYDDTSTITIAAPTSGPIACTLTAGSTAVTMSSTQGLHRAMVVYGTGRPNVMIASVNSGTSITLSLPAIANGSVNLTFVGKQAIFTPVVAAGSLVGFAQIQMGTGYFSTPTHSMGGAGSGATITLTTTNGIVSIPVTSGGSAYPGVFTINITDSTGADAIAVPIMGGIQASDVVTYSTTAGWCNTILGLAYAQSGTVPNYSGSFEPTFGGAFPFNMPADYKQLLLGTNFSDTTVDTAIHQPNSNWLKRVPVGPSGVATQAPDGKPLTISAWSSGSPIQFQICSFSGAANGVDNTGFPLPDANGTNGRYWYFIADDTGSSGDLTQIAFNANGGSSQIGTTVIAGTSTTGVNALTLTGGGSGYTYAPNVTITDVGGTGSGAQAYCLINANGEIYYLALKRCGSGYSGSGLTITFTGGGGSGATATGTTGTVTINRTWRGTCVGGPNVGGGFGFGMWKNSNLDYTLVGEALYTPDTSNFLYPTVPTRDNVPAIEGGMLNVLTTASGYYPACIRFYGTEEPGSGFTWVIDGCDVASDDSYSWWTVNSSVAGNNPTGTRTVTFDTIRPYTGGAPASDFPSGWGVTTGTESNFIYFPDQTENTSAVTANGSWTSYPPGSGAGGGPFQMSPSNPGFVNGIGTGSANSNTFVGELVNSAGTAHNLRTGAFFNVPGSNWTGTYHTSNGTGATASWTGVPYYPSSEASIFVTGPDSVAFWGYNTNVPTGQSVTGLPGLTNNVAQTYSVSVSLLINSPDQFAMPFVTAFKIAADMPGCAAWINIPYAASDAFVQSAIAWALSNTVAGTKIYIEYCNEHWNGQFPQYNFIPQMGNLGGWSSASYIGPDQEYALRASQIHAKFTTGFTAAGRAADVYRTYGTQMNVDGVAQNMVNYLATNSLPMDAVHSAPYIDAPFDETSPSVAVTAGSATGTDGLIPAGNYYVAYTWVDALTGIETAYASVVNGNPTGGPFAVGTNQHLPITIPAFPLWGAGTANIYLGTSAGTLELYLTGQTGTNIILGKNADWNDNTQAYGSAPGPPGVNLYPSPSVLCAALATHWPYSKCYQNAIALPMGFWIDYLRFFVKYGYLNLFNGLQGDLNAFYASPAFTVPQLVAYEGGWETGLAPYSYSSTDVNGLSMANGLLMDVVYNPRFAELQEIYWAVLQQGGFTLTNDFLACSTWGGFTNGGINGMAQVTTYAFSTHNSQPAGFGDGTAASNGLDMGSFSWVESGQATHPFNPSVRWAAWRDWANNSNAPSITLPVVTGISPNQGPVGGASSVTISGSGFTGVTSVHFGATLASSFTFVNDGQIRVSSPAGTGTVDITVTTPFGTSLTSSDDQFTYVVAPTVSGVSPTSGPAGGGTSVTITGTGFSTTTAIQFGSTFAFPWVVVSSTELTVNSPSGSAGVVDVTVTNPGGISATSSADHYTYTAIPTVGNVSPPSGLATGGTAVTVTGTNFTGATAVHFGATVGTSLVVVSPTEITITSPAHAAGTIDVTVTTPSGTSPTGSSDQFTYTAAATPTVSGVSPNVGHTSGQNGVAITGTGFTGATAVNFGSGSAFFAVNSSTSITANAPAGSAGTVDVTVTTSAGTSSTSPADQFIYVPQPTVTSVVPAFGPVGTPVVITGTGFTRTTAIQFGGVFVGDGWDIVSDSTILTSAPQASGVTDVTVTSPGGISTTSPADHFTYVSAGGSGFGASILLVGA